MTKTKPEADLRKLPLSWIPCSNPVRGESVLQGIFGHDLTVSAIREAVGNVRKKKVGREAGTVPLPEILMVEVAALLETWTIRTLSR